MSAPFSGHRRRNALHRSLCHVQRREGGLQCDVMASITSLGTGHFDREDKCLEQDEDVSPVALRHTAKNFYTRAPVLED